METTVSGPVGVFAAKHAVEAGKNAPERVTIRRLPMAEKIATSRDWDLPRNVRIALKDLVRLTEVITIGQLGPRALCPVAAA